MTARGLDTWQRLAALNLQAAEDGRRWTVANNGTGARIWFLVREDRALPYEERYHTNTRGDVILYTLDGALARAETLNARELQAAPME